MGHEEVEDQFSHPFFDHVGDCVKCFRATTVLKNNLDAFCIDGLLSLSKRVPLWIAATGRVRIEEEVVREIDRRTVLDQMANIK